MRKEEIHQEVQNMIAGGVNPFMYYIYNKKKHNFFWWLKYRSFLKYLDTLSPDFYMLLAMSDFVKLLSILFAYPNDSKTSKIYSYQNLKKSDVSSFGINDPNFKLEYTLYHNEKKSGNPNQIAITFKRLSEFGGTSQTIFDDGHCTIIFKEDNLFMHNIINWTMIPIKELFIIYYKSAPELPFIEPTIQNPDHYLFNHSFK